MTLSEVEILMQELGRHVSDQTHILFGAAVDARLGDRLSVTIISSLSAEEEEFAANGSHGEQCVGSLPIREQYQAAAPEPEVKTEEPVLEVQTLEDTIPFEEPVATETEPPQHRSLSNLRDTDSYGEPEHAISTPQERRSRGTKIKGPRKSHRHHQSRKSCNSNP